MKLLIVGATGATGQQLVQQALERGRSVTAFLRDPARLRSTHPLLGHVVGDVMNAASVETAVTGHDAALCARVTGTGGFMDLDARRPVAPPEAVLAAYRSLPTTEDHVDLSSSIKARSRPPLRPRWPGQITK